MLRPSMGLFLLTISAFAQSAPVKFQDHTVGTGLTGGYQVIAVDMNHDGKPDLIALASGLHELVWYENPGWQRHVIVTGINQPINATVVDTDKNGIPVLVLAHEFSPDPKKSKGTISLLESTGDLSQEWKRTDIDAVPTAHRLRMVNGLVVNAPLTSPDAGPPDYRGHTPLYSYKPGEWKRQLITDADEGVVHCIYPFDWDGDGRQDILTASFSGVYLLRSLKDGKWERTKLAAGSPDPWPKSGASDVAVGKLGSKRFLTTIEPWHGNVVAVYTQSKPGSEWQRQVIDNSLADGHVLLTADLDGNGKDVIIASFRGKGRSVYLYRNNGSEWVKTVLDDGGMAGAGCTVADLNGDGKPDIACIGTGSANLKWYENLGNGGER